MAPPSAPQAHSFKPRKKPKSAEGAPISFRVLPRFPRFKTGAFGAPSRL
jgi:hypothetical protein